MSSAGDGGRGQCLSEEEEVSAPFKEQRTQGTPSTLQCDGSFHWGLSLQRPFLPLPVPPTQRESRLSDHCPHPHALRISPGERHPLLQAGRPRVGTSSSLSFRAAGLLAAHPQLPFPRLASPLPSAAGGGDLHWLRVGPVRELEPRVRAFCSCRYLCAPLQMAERVMRSEEGVTCGRFKE